MVDLLRAVRQSLRASVESYAIKTMEQFYAARATGIGCFYDDPVHDILGLKDHRFQSLYHFTVGAPVDDARLTTAPGYSWEVKTGSRETW